MKTANQIGGSDILRDLLTELNKAFGGRIPKEQLKIYLKELNNLNVPFEDIATGFKMAMLHEKRFPSYSTLRDYMPKPESKTNTGLTGFNAVDTAKYEDEEKKLDTIRGFFKNDLDKKNKYIQYWTELAWGKNFRTQSVEYGLTLKTFEKPALFDLAQNLYSLDGLETIVKKNNLKAEKYI